MGEGGGLGGEGGFGTGRWRGSSVFGRGRGGVAALGWGWGARSAAGLVGLWSGVSCSGVGGEAVRGVIPYSMVRCLGTA